MNKKTFAKIGSMAVVAIAFMSCSQEASLYDPEVAVLNQKAEQYKASFEQKYGTIDPNQSWDLSTGSTGKAGFSLSSSSASKTRSIYDYKFDIIDWDNWENEYEEKHYSFANSQKQITVEKKVSDWMFTNMKAGNNNVKQGSPFQLVVPETGWFTLVPMFQGTASYYWQLWMEVTGMPSPQLVWSKGDNLSYRTSAESTEWIAPGTSNTGISKQAYEVKAPAITFTNLPANHVITFYLKVWSSESAYNNDKNGDKADNLASTGGYMLALRAGDDLKPACVPDTYEVKFIGCEDNYKANSDNDYEDLVFMLYGAPAPPVVQIEDGEQFKTKRFMMEDLGSIGDFDFNDVVVDIQTERAAVKNTFTTDKNGARVLLKTEVEHQLPDQAIIRALGGTLDFTLQIGETTWSKSQLEEYEVTDMLNTGIDGEIFLNRELAKFEVKGFYPLENNLSLTVKDKTSGKPYTIQFPKEGEAPMIVAMDVNELKPWMRERVSVPKSWIKNAE